MSEAAGDATFRRVADADPSDAIIIEGLPGQGLVASIAVDHITKQLELEHFGSISADAFPPVVTFDNGIVHDLVRVYASESPAVMTLQSDLALPPQSFEALSHCVQQDLYDHVRKAIFIAGAPAESEEQIGEIRAVATNERVKAELEAADVPIAEHHGIVGGNTGALMRSCYRADADAAMLIVRAHPRLPDPTAAIAVIEQALEPLVDFEIDTTELEDHAEEIQSQMRQIAQQYEQVSDQGGRDRRALGMYQ